jgi:hypothetical protein
MKLNHLNLCTSDVVSLSGIFSRHFSFEALQTNDGYSLLRGSEGFSLILTKIDEHSPKTYPNSVSFTLSLIINFTNCFKLLIRFSKVRKHLPEFSFSIFE